MNKNRLLIGLVLIIAIVLAASGVYTYTNYKIVNGKLVSVSEFDYTDIEQAFRQAYDEGDTDAQVEYAQKMQSLGIDPTQSDLYLAQALVNKGSLDFEEAENSDKAVALLNAVLLRDPNNAEALSTLAYAHEMKGDFPKAFEFYNLALKTDPEDDDIYVRRGHAYDLTGEWEKAENDYAKALELNSENSAAAMNIARLYYRIGESDLAVEYADKAIDLSENVYVKATAADLIGQVSIDTDEYDLALEYFNYAIDVNPDFAGAYEHRAYVELIGSNGKKGAELGDVLTKATADIATAEGINPKSSFIYTLKGLVAESQGRKDIAQSLYMKSLALVDTDITLGVVDKENMKIEVGDLLAQSK
jgi:tetratricopeptide (TPR) repeat protein